MPVDSIQNRSDLLIVAFLGVGVAGSPDLILLLILKATLSTKPFHRQNYK